MLWLSCSCGQRRRDCRSTLASSRRAFLASNVHQEGHPCTGRARIRNRWARPSRHVEHLLSTQQAWGWLFCHCGCQVPCWSRRPSDFRPGGSKSPSDSLRGPSRNPCVSHRLSNRSCLSPCASTSLVENLSHHPIYASGQSGPLF